MTSFGLLEAGQESIICLQAIITPGPDVIKLFESVI
jgi:hypothetical protein